MGEKGENMAETCACDTLDVMSEIWALVKEQSRNDGGERAYVAGLVDAELIRFLSFITAALSKSEDTISEAMRDVECDLPDEVSSDACGPSVWLRLIKIRSGSLHVFPFFLTVVSVVQFCLSFFVG